ncbi:penicillin-binding protein, partial [Dactylosporangium sp. NPDC051485]
MGSASVGKASVGSASVGRAVVGDGASGPPAETTGKGKPTPTAKAKKRRRRNILIASIAAFIMIAGIGMVSGTYYFDQVALPDDIAINQSTTIYYSDGVTPMGRIGE